MDHDDEPVFKKSRWGTNHYIYNPRNPVGLALIVISLLFLVVMMVLMGKNAGPFAPPADPTPWSPPPVDEERLPPSAAFPDVGPAPEPGHPSAR